MFVQNLFDTHENLTDSTNFDFYSAHEFHKLKNKDSNLARRRKQNLCSRVLGKLFKKEGCGFYINKAITYINRPNLDKRHKGKSSEFEAKWIELIFLSGEKIIIGSIYRHLKPHDHSFLTYLKKLTKNIEKKKITLTGNINLHNGYLSNIRANKDTTT